MRVGAGGGDRPPAFRDAVMYDVHRRFRSVACVVPGGRFRRSRPVDRKVNNDRTWRHPFRSSWGLYEVRPFLRWISTAPITSPTARGIADVGGDPEERGHVSAASRRPKKKKYRSGPDLCHKEDVATEARRPPLAAFAPTRRRRGPSRSRVHAVTPPSRMPRPSNGRSSIGHLLAGSCGPATSLIGLRSGSWPAGVADRFVIYRVTPDAMTSRFERFVAAK